MPSPGVGKGGGRRQGGEGGRLGPGGRGAGGGEGGPHARADVLDSSSMRGGGRKRDAPGSPERGRAHRGLVTETPGPRSSLRWDDGDYWVPR